MRRRVLIILSLLCATVCATAQSRKEREIEDARYRRSSLYSLMVSHTNMRFCDEIERCFLAIPTPEGFNNHDLSVKVINSFYKLEGGKGEAKKDITEFLEKNKVASRLVGKWFMRDYETGECKMDLVAERGLYAASEIDKAKAELGIRGQNAILADAGEDLIQNTFVLVNDIEYKDKNDGALKTGGVIRVIGVVVQALTNSSSDAIFQMAEKIETVKGFKVKIHTSLYQLVWDEDVASTVYDNWGKKEEFEKNRDKFKLKYIGSQLSDGATTSFIGINEEQPELMIRKACQRALDENIANLQKNFPVFRVKTPLEETEPLAARIGMKEGINENSRFEVLEPQKDEDGKVRYIKVGEIRPEKGKIWDNRFMSVEEGAENATLGKTIFRQTSGRKLMPGYLIMQTK